MSVYLLLKITHIDESKLISCLLPTYFLGPKLFVTHIEH